MKYNELTIAEDKQQQYHVATRTKYYYLNPYQDGKIPIFREGKHEESP